MDTEKIISLSNEYASDEVADGILRVALDVGEGLLKSGGEIRRVETTIEKICSAYGAAHVEVFSIQSLILASVRMPDGGYSSQTRRIADVQNHMLCLEAFNALSRRICAETPDIATVDEEIERIKKKRRYPIYASLLGCVFAAGGFAILFGGSPRDALAAALIGLVIGLLDRTEIFNFNKLAKTLFLSFLSGMLTCLSVIVGIGQSMDMIAIGTIMLLIPGLSLGNAMRDLLCGDTLTGTLKTVQACITAIMIATGYALAILLLGRFCPVREPFSAGILTEVILKLSAAFLGTVGFALMFKTAFRRLWIAGLGGIITYAIFEITVYFGSAPLVAALFAALFMHLAAEICAKLFRAPAILFFLCFAIPIVPGGSLYYAMYNMLSYNSSAALHYLGNTAQILLGMVLGICLSSVLLSIFEKISLACKKK